MLLDAPIYRQRRSGEERAPRIPSSPGTVRSTRVSFLKRPPGRKIAPGGYMILYDILFGSSASSAYSLDLEDVGGTGLPERGTGGDDDLIADLDDLGALGAVDRVLVQRVGTRLV